MTDDYNPDLPERISWKTRAAQITNKDHIRRARQGVRRFVKTALVDIKDAAAKDELFVALQKDLEQLRERRHEPMTDGLKR